MLAEGRSRTLSTSWISSAFSEFHALEKSTIHTTVRTSRLADAEYLGYAKRPRLRPVKKVIAPRVCKTVKASQSSRILETFVADPLR